MAKVEYMVAKSMIVFATSTGPSAKLREGERIEASKVADNYLDGVRAGKYPATIEKGDAESSDDGNGGSGEFDPTQHKADEVMSYLESLEGDGADAEIARVKAAEAANKGPGRPSTRVASFEKKE